MPVTIKRGGHGSPGFDELLIAEGRRARPQMSPCVLFGSEQKGQNDSCKLSAFHPVRLYLQNRPVDQFQATGLFCVS
jgi:hypothetical protein